MAFEWLKDFHRETEKSDNYAEKVLAAYRLGIKAGGSIRGVRLYVEGDCCDAAKALPSDTIFHPDDVPHLPLPECPFGSNCRCAYRPVMSYELVNE